MNVRSAADRFVFGVTNLLAYLRHPRLAERFRKRQRRWPNFATPATMSELVQWRKVFDHNPLFPVLTDKLAAKQWAAERFPDLETPETLWVGDRPEDIPAAMVEPDVVLKTNNASTQNLFPHRDTADHAEVVRRFRRWMPNPFVDWVRRGLAGKAEWAYNSIPRKVFAERRLVAGPGHEVVDISIRVFGGVPHSVSCATDYKTDATRVAFFWVDGERMTVPATEDSSPELPADFAFPATMPRALAAATRIGHGVDYLRVDFLTDGDRLYLGEITIYPASGFGADDWRAASMYRHWLAAIEVSWFLSAPQPWPLSLYAAAFRRWARRRNAELAAAAVNDPGAPPAPPAPAP